jgi:formamidopyrimidine-DNA glycosylase
LNIKLLKDRRKTFMLELPEAEVISRQISATLAGKQIGSIIANHTPHKFAWFNGEASTYPERLNGKTLVSARAFGGNVEIHLDGTNLLLGTSIRFHAATEKIPAKHQLLLTFTDATALSASVQMWGALLCYQEGDMLNFIEFDCARGKPSPLYDAFDRAYFDLLFEENTPKLSAKAFLATEQRFPGLGNGVLQDILWTARIHPRRKMFSLSAREKGQMFSAVKHVLQQMVVQGGRDTEKDLFGCPGGYMTILSKNTVGTPCPHCGSLIQKEAYMGGSIYFCTVCQILG